jgi:aminopeptidase N
MEYPGAVLITDTLYEMGSEDILEYVVAHEVAHQWWYAMVGNDEIDDPWLDESLTEYSTLLYYKERYGEARFKEEYRYNIELNLALYSLAAPGTMRVGRPISAYDDSLLYTMAVYKRGTQMFYELHRQMGDQAFFSAMRAYFDDMFLLNAGKEDLYAALEAASGRDWSGVIEGYLGG